MQNRFSTQVIGLMSGTSLDGLDIAACSFRRDEGDWEYTIDIAETIEYPQELRSTLAQAMQLDAAGITRLDADLGVYFGKKVFDFVNRHHLHPAFISSHGHTVFHQPSLGFSLQIGKGSHIAVRSGLPVVCDFRSSDVALGGQGAPLVPIGDRLLFGQFSACLNLGGIANVSMEKHGQRMAYDICPVNMALNLLAEKCGVQFDIDGAIARSGKMIPEILDQFNSLEFYRQPSPKSLGREWFDRNFKPIITSDHFEVNDMMRTVCEHIAHVISTELGPHGGQILVTGGGAWNGFLMERITELSKPGIHIPSAELVNFKEALVFAFLGVLRWLEIPNSLRSVTGAARDISAGCIYLP